MKLSRNILRSIDRQKTFVPSESALDMPEKILQFGTGRLLRALPDYYIDKANKRNIFNGRVVVVKSTSRGDVAPFKRQNGLYTICERGIREGNEIKENIISSAISRVLTAHDQWEEILKCVRSNELEIIISNTTEVGIQLDKNDRVEMSPPVSFPGKLLSILYERFKTIHAASGNGFVIIPTELIPDNGSKLKSIVITLAKLNQLSENFIRWIENENSFCNSLVDRIVTGMPDKNTRQQIESELGYEDDLLTVSEVYRLWAIEGDAEIKEKLSFSRTDDSVIIEPDIDRYRELKLRLLNGTHTLTCGLAFLAGYKTVVESMRDEISEKFISALMKKEIGIAIPYEIDRQLINDFADKVLDRFRNPYIQHLWKNITLNYSSKMGLRCIPVLKEYQRQFREVPPLFSLGFAAYLRFMKVEKMEEGSCFGISNGEYYLIEDPAAPAFYRLWKNGNPEKIVLSALEDKTLWGEDLNNINGFAEGVIRDLKSILKDGMKKTLQTVVSEL